MCYRNYPNISLITNLEKKSIPDLLAGYDKYSWGLFVYIQDDVNLEQKVTKGDDTLFRFQRSVSTDELLSMKKMPGFEIKWHFNEDIDLYPTIKEEVLYNNHFETKQFVRYVFTKK